MAPVPDASDNFVLEGEDLQAEGPCVEEGVGRVVVPKKGKLFADDGTVEVAIIRPCVSRGRRLKGLPPIYEAEMLGRNAGVFTDWHMWMGHMSAPMRQALEELEEQLQEAASPRRLFSELGGRVMRTWFSPDLRMAEDDTHGYRPGGVMGRVIPYPASKQILEADPDGLHVSIAAWPTSARSASPSWDPGTRGMAIEGFRSKPRGSVDWVLRGGAGGQPIGRLTEAEERAASTLGSYYSLPISRPSPGKDGMAGIDLKTATAEQLREQLAADNPALAEALGIKAPPAPPAPATSGSLTQADLDRALAEQETRINASWAKKLQEHDDDVEGAVDEALQEHRLAEANQRTARALITKSGLPERWQEDLLVRYSILPSGASRALLTEEETDDKGVTVSAQDVLKNRVAEDIQHARDLISASGGVAQVTGLGGVKQQRPAATQKDTTFRDWLRESGDDLGKTEEEDAKVKAFIMEGVS